jgi:hypothetical protein
MRRFALTAAMALAASLGISTVAQAANTYTVSLARVTPANAGTLASPKPARIEFGYKVGTDNGQRPAVTTDYTIGFGTGIAATNKLRDARSNKVIWNQCPQRLATTNSCPANTKLGSGIVNNQAGDAAKPSDPPIPCRLNLTVSIGDGKLFPPGQNDGKRVYADLWLGLKSVPGLCPLAVDAALPAQLVRYKRGTALAFHVPKSPFQQPLPGVDNAVVEVTSNVFKSRRGVNVRKRVGRRTVIVKQTRGFFEAIGCTRRVHRVEVQFTNTTGVKSTAFANAPCVP